MYCIEYGIRFDDDQVISVKLIDLMAKQKVDLGLSENSQIILDEFSRHLPDGPDVVRAVPIFDKTAARAMFEGLKKLVTESDPNTV